MHPFRYTPPIASLRFSLGSLTHGRTSIILRLALCAIVSHALFGVLRSGILADVIGRPYAGPFRLSVLPVPVPVSLIWPFLLLTGFMFMQGAGGVTTRPTRNRVAPWICGFLAASIALAFVTHLSAETRAALASLLEARPIAGRLLIGLPMYALLLAPAACVLGAVFPFSTLKKHAALLFFGACLPPLFIAAAWAEMLFYKPLARAVLFSSHAIMRVFSSEARIDVDALVLGYKSFDAWVGPACLGLDVLAAVFALAILPLCLARGKRSSIGRLAIALAGLTIALYALNALRIAALVFIGGLSPAIAVAAFHGALGMVIAGVLFVAYLRYAIPWIEKP